MLKINNSSILAIALASLLGFQGCTQKEQSLPNIVLIMADDIGLGDLSCNHRQRTEAPPLVTTPNLDLLASEGMQFTDAHSPGSLCAPTRFSMMTGNYSHRTIRPGGVWPTWDDALIEPRYTTIARIAKKGGYHTSFFGKWGLGGVWNGKPDDFSRIEEGALYYGFDYAVELTRGIQDPPYIFYENQEWMKIKPNSTLVQILHEQTGYAYREPAGRRNGIGDSNWDPILAGGILARKAVDYIEKQVKNHAGEPFFMYYCSQAVHVPHTPPAELDGKTIAGETPGRHGDMILELDTQIGMIIRALKETGVYENTLIVFTSDNGGLTLDPDMVAAGHVTSNGLRDRKGSIYEGGHRVPFIAVWPGKIKPNSVSDVPIVSHDMVATMAALTGQPIDRDTIIDSGNLLPYFLENETKPMHKYLVHWSGHGPRWAIREGDWKLIMVHDVSPEELEGYQRKYENRLMPMVPEALFNMKDNYVEDEAGNLINDPEQAGRVKEMMETYISLRQEFGPTMIE